MDFSIYQEPMWPAEPEKPHIAPELLYNVDEVAEYLEALKAYHRAYDTYRLEYAKEQDCLDTEKETFRCDLFDELGIGCSVKERAAFAIAWDEKFEEQGYMGVYLFMKKLKEIM